MPRNCEEVRCNFRKSCLNKVMRKTRFRKLLQLYGKEERVSFHGLQALRLLTFGKFTQKIGIAILSYSSCAWSGFALASSHSSMNKSALFPCSQFFALYALPSAKITSFSIDRWCQRLQRILSPLLSHSHAVCCCCSSKL